MHTHTLVAVFPSRPVAEEVRRGLADSGVPYDDVGISEIGRPSAEAHQPEEKRGFWDWLFGTDIPENDKNWYQSRLDESRTAVSVRVDAEVRSKVEGILAEHSPISMEENDSMEENEANSLDEGRSEFPPETGRSEFSEDASGGSSEEMKIPIVREELEVGKRRTEQRHRIRVYPVERQAREQVDLRDETMVIERRPVSSDTSPSPEALEPRDIEIVESHEEPVVAKCARTVEEVVVRKDIKDRTETIDDTVRETKVEVDSGRRKP